MRDSSVTSELNMNLEELEIEVFSNGFLNFLPRKKFFSRQKKIH